MEAQIVTQEEAQSLATVDRDLLPWQAQPGEPHMWYNRFSLYYLAQPGMDRNLSLAYRQYRIDTAETDEERQRIRSNGSIPVSESWWSNCKEWDWRGRALAYDQHLINLWLDQNSQAVLTYKAQNLSLWSRAVTERSRELAGREVGELSENQLTSTIKTIAAQIDQSLPQQPQLSLHIHAIHPDLQKLIRDAIESRE